MTVEDFDKAVNAAADKMIAANRRFQQAIDTLVKAADGAGISGHIVAACLDAAREKIEREAS